MCHVKMLWKFFMVRAPLAATASVAIICGLNWMSKLALNSFKIACFHLTYLASSLCPDYSE